MTTLKSYMKQIVTLYKNASADYGAKVERLRQLNDEISRIWGDRKLTTEGKSDKRARLSAEVDAIKRELDAISRDTKAKAAKIRADVEHDFKGLYSAQAEQVDTNTLELLKTGILTDSELIELANKYAYNATMRRIVGKYAGERESREMRYLANVCERASNTPHLDAIDGLIRACNYSIGDAPLSGIYGAGQLGQKLDIVTASCFEQAPNIAYEWRDGTQHFSSDKMIQTEGE